jgi:4-amino-4-deoxy-L-arabinose transferase-like glycosyltransferase
MAAAAHLVRRHWPTIVAAASVAGYAVAILGFGLTFRPLNTDEVVTLAVASEPSPGDVLDTALNVRHGPPLHYLLVHAALEWHRDALGLRLPSALLGIAAVALSWGAGRELLGGKAGALVPPIVAISPMTVHLGQFARGYTALIAFSFASLWVLLVLARTRRLRWAPLYALTALLLASSHPFGLFALASELVLLAGLGLWPLRRELRRPGRRAAAVLLALALGAVVLALLYANYAGLEGKYAVGRGGPVVDLADGEFWRPFAAAVTGTSQTWMQFVLAAVALLGVAVLARENRRAAFVVVVWIGLPLAALSLLTAGSTDFAPERHLSFLLPAYAAALASAAVWLGERAARDWHGTLAACVVLALVIAPAAVADYRDIGGFTPDLRDASLHLAEGFAEGDVLLTTSGRRDPGIDPRLYGDYAVLLASADQPLSRWRSVGASTGCALAETIGDQQPAPRRAWLMMHTGDGALPPLRRPESLTRFGEFVVAALPVPRRTVPNALRTGSLAHARAARAFPEVNDLRNIAGVERLAAALAAGGRCSGLAP